MKKPILFVAILLQSYLITAQVDTTYVPFVSYWSTGDAYKFQITKIKKQWKEGNLTKNDSSSYHVNFEVIDSTESSYTIKWSYEADPMGDFGLSEEFASTFEKYQNIDIIYKTSELGTFLGIQNWQEVSDMTKEIFSKVIDALSKEDKSKSKKVRKAMEPLLAVYSSKEGLEQVIFKELQYFHFPFGLEYAVNDTIKYEDQLPNMLGGDPFRADSKIYIEAVDFEEAYCTLIHTMKINSDDTKEMLRKLFKQMGMKDKDLKQALKTAVFDIQDRNHYEYFYYPGVPSIIETTRTTKMDIGNEGGESIEQTRIELVH